jgi:hypothetical protein
VGGVDGDVIGGEMDGAVGGSEVLKGGVGAALDSAVSGPGASESAANSNQATPAATGDAAAVNPGLEDTMSVGTAGTPLPAVDASAAGADEDVEMT